MLHEDGAVGKLPFAGGGKRNLFAGRIRFARNRNPAQLRSAIRPEGRVQIVGHQTVVRRQALNVSEGTGEREQRWHLAGLALRHSQVSPGVGSGCQAIRAGILLSLDRTHFGSCQVTVQAKPENECLPQWLTVSHHLTLAFCPYLSPASIAGSGTRAS